MLLHALFFALFATAVNGGTLISDLPPPTDVKLVLVAFRHANRNPVQFLPNDSNKGSWGLEGVAQLTNIGKRESFAYGQMLRERYGNILKEQWFPSEMQAISSSADRTQGSIQATLAGLYPPKGFAQWSDMDWSPVPYKIDDPLVRAYKIKCPAADIAWADITNLSTPEAAALFNDNKDTMDFLVEKTGFKPTLSDIADIADNIKGMYIRNLTMPDWITNNVFNENMRERVEKFAEANQVLCSKHEPCRRLMSGFWLDHVGKQIEKAAAGNDHPKMMMYSTHNEIMSSLLWMLGYERDHGVPSHGSGILEYRDTPSKQVRLIYSQPTRFNQEDRENQVVKMKFCPDSANNEGWCPLETFLGGIRPARIADYKTECRQPVCFCAPYPGNANSP